MRHAPEHEISKRRGLGRGGCLVALVAALLTGCEADREGPASSPDVGAASTTEIAAAPARNARSAQTPAPAPPPAPPPVAAATEPPPAAPPTRATAVRTPPSVEVTIAPTTDPIVTAMPIEPARAGESFAANAFPPTMPDTEWHRAGWMTNDCMRCHETGVEAAPVTRHVGLPPILLKAKCRSCHVIAPGKAPTGLLDNTVDPRFEANAFPPMIPNSASHQRAWTARDCLLCHESGIKGAPLVKHEGLPTIYLRAKCRTCHVQVRSDETDPWP